MQNNETNIKLFLRNFCDFLLDNDNKLKEQRIKLNALFCFTDSYGYFKFLDKNKKNYIDISDISLFLSIYKIKYNKSLLNNIFKKYDKDGDLCWNSLEYLNFINKDINYQCNNNLCPKEYNIQNYEKELAKLFELEINSLKYIGIKIKALKELINEKVINTKKIFNIIKQNKDQKNIDANLLMIFLNEGNYYLPKEKAYKLISIISNGKDFITEKLLDNIFKYDKYINDTELIYPKCYKNFDYKSNKSFQKYKNQFPLNDFGITNYSILNIPIEDKIKDKLNGMNNNNTYNFKDIQNNIINDSGDNEYNDNYFKTSIQINENIYKENPLLISNNSMSQKELENIYSYTLNDFSFRK